MPEKFLADIPDALIDDATRRIGSFLVGFVRLTTDARGQDAHLAGSGTLIRIRETYGILTAQHVLDSLPMAGPIGLVLPKSADAPRHPGKPLVLAESTRRIGFGRALDESEGPDLAVLVLAPSDVDWLRARKSFFDLHRWQEGILSDQRDVAHQLYALSGFPDELTSQRGPEGGYDDVKEFRGLSFFSFIDSETVEGDFDYVTFVVGYGGGPSDPPRSFKGFSGGGLWHVELLGNTLEETRIGNCLLLGVGFYQGELVNNQRLIKCHWRRSIYEQLVQKVISSIG